ncbi:Primosomal protein N' (replication factor Y) -superfamily II helicase, partial [hydrothermal vent metagenome]
SRIHREIKRDIGGDEQRIDSVDTRYQDASFKHILLPVWISAYRYRNKLYQILVNARTGEVQGLRPYSWIKITLAVSGAVAIIALGVYGYLYATGELS